MTMRRYLQLHHLLPAVVLLVKSANASVVNLTPDNYDKLTEGKTVFLRFFTTWCDHSRKMAPAWEKLGEDWNGDDGGGSSFGLVGEVDCSGAGRPLCKAHNVKGFPTLKYGDPTELEDYEGARSYEDLALFAKENLRPPCSVSNTENCDPVMKQVIDDYMAKDTPELLDLIDAEEEKLAEVTATYEKKVERLQEAYEQLSKEKNEAIEKAQNEGLSLLKPVLAYKKKLEAARLGKDEL